jgi:hypothetical protein
LRFVTHSHKNAEVIINGQPELKTIFDEFRGVIGSITEHEIIDDFKSKYEGKSKSLSLSINYLIDKKLRDQNWEEQSKLFGESDYGNDRRWRLDFAKRVEILDKSLPGHTVVRESGIAVEVAFNHAEAIAWNLLKPTLASEQNHVKKAIQADLGIIVAASEELKTVGAFDSAVGTYEKFLTYIRPLSGILSSPILMVGLEAPETFHVRLETRPGNKKVGFIEMGPKPSKLK